MSYGAVRKSDSRRRRRKRRIRRIVVCCLLLVLVLLVIRTVSHTNRIFGQITSMKLRADGYPESLTKLLERNPETRQFVLDYEEKKNLDEEIDITGEVTVGEIPLFIQWDERWGYRTYGDDFLALTGCGPTCLSMVCCGLGGDTQWNPYAVACMAEENGYYVEGSGSSWDLMDSGARNLGLVSETVIFDETHIVERLKEGHPIICTVGPGDFTTTGHFVVLCGVNDDGEIIVHDPNSKKNSEKTWKLKQLMPQIKNLWSYSLS